MAALCGVWLQGDLSPRSEFALQTKSGLDRTIRWANVLLRETDGSVTGILSVGSGITESLRAEHARDEALKELLDLKSRLETENTRLKLDMEETATDIDIIGQSDAIRYRYNPFRVRVVNGDYSWRYRNEVKLQRDFEARHRPFTVYVPSEPFWDSRFEKWNRICFAGGLVLPLKKRWELES